MRLYTLWRNRPHFTVLNAARPNNISIHRLIHLETRPQLFAPLAIPSAPSAPSAHVSGRVPQSDNARRHTTYSYISDTRKPSKRAASDMRGTIISAGEVTRGVKSTTAHPPPRFPQGRGVGRWASGAKLTLVHCRNNCWSRDGNLKTVHLLTVIQVMVLGVRTGQQEEYLHRPRWSWIS